MLYMSIYINIIIHSFMDLSYISPTWAGELNPLYYIETLKGGKIIENIPFTQKKLFLIFGRCENSDIRLENPSISRYHAIIQYCNKNVDNKFPGYYIYDLRSTHGTYLNKNKLEPQRYYRLHVGYVIKFGASSRLYILNGPNEDQEQEYDNIEVAKLTNDMSEDDISWGIKENIEDEIYAHTKKDIDSDLINESHFVNDPKKYLKIFFENQGEEFDFEIKEINTDIKKFQCNLILNFDDLMLATNESERLIEFTSFSKKDAINMCCLAACRLLNMHGILKNPNKSRKITERELNVRKLISDDFYESDEDEFSDRTGILQCKREMRRKRLGHFSTEDVANYGVLVENSIGTNQGSKGEGSHTYESLKTTINEIEKELKELDILIENIENPTRLEDNILHVDVFEKNNNDLIKNSGESDPLDLYMNTIKKISKIGPKFNPSQSILLSLTQKKNSLLKSKEIYDKMRKIAEPSTNVKKMFYANTPTTLSTADDHVVTKEIISDGEMLLHKSPSLDSSAKTPCKEKDHDFVVPPIPTSNTKRQRMTSNRKSFESENNNNYISLLKNDKIDIVKKIVTDNQNLESKKTKIYIS
ncbi:kanadaptin-like isoform X2 [Gordionus sp. m RMFG-2023]|uniref:kanadaptin-like isoform X2 n=1 Tax=Gordionus sp. m RMFG-2023 TaxID=3053472 RepID=UPI0031FDA350